MRSSASEVETKEDVFKRGLAEASVIIGKLAPMCQDVEHLLDILKLGLEDESQCLFLMNVVSRK